LPNETSGKMKTYVTLLLILLLLAVIFPSLPPRVKAQETNLILNPGFEDGINAWHTSDGKVVFVPDVTTLHTGSQSIQGIETSVGSLGRLYQDVSRKLSSGNQCQISGWIKTSNVNGQAVIGLDYVALNGATPADGYVNEIGYVTGTQDWAFFQSPVFTLPPMPNDAVSLWLLLDFNNGVGTAWWDDLSLILVSNTTISQVSNIEIFQPTVVNNLNDFNSLSYQLGYGLYADDTISVTVSPSALIQQVQIHFNNVAYPDDLILTKMGDDNYSIRIKAVDSAGILAIILQSIAPGSFTDTVGIVQNVPPVISSIVATDTSGQTHEKTVNMVLPTAEGNSAMSPFTGVMMACPVDISVTDDENRTSGTIIVNGNIENVNNVPGAYFVGQSGSDSTKIILLPKSSQIYTITAHAFNTGQYNLTVFSTLDGRTFNSVVSKTGQIVANELFTFSFTEDNSGNISLNSTTTPTPSGFGNISTWIFWIILVLAILICTIVVLVKLRGQNRSHIAPNYPPPPPP
jgi:hypothetical protein